MSEEKLYTFENEEYRKTYWHTCSHVLAQAMKRLHPEVKLAIGPSIDNGFYYDFDTPAPFTPEDLAALEGEMRKICKEKLKLERFELPRAEAIKFMEELEEPYKVELINDLPEDAVISFYKQGDFTDLCAGPHLDSTGRIKGNAIKLTSATGAYWRGDSSRKMLQRIYGVAFPKKEELDAYLEQQAEALKRDHNKLGRELEYFTTVDYIGQGLPILLPKGARVIQQLQRWVEDTEERRGYQLTKTPLMAKRDLYRISGHWDHYLDGMFVLGDPHDEEKECFALRPMTCPFQYQVYLNRQRSYRDLPMRLGETSTLFRSHPGGQSTCIFFNKQSQSAFIAAHGSTVDDVRQYFFVVFVDVVHTEFFSKKHIDLNGYDGIFFAEYVFNLDVQFRTIESSFVNANFVVDAEVIKQFFHYALSVFPLFCSTFVFSGVSRIPLGETEGAVFF